MKKFKPEYFHFNEKLVKKIFYVKLIYLISQVFCPDFFNFSGPLWQLLTLGLAQDDFVLMIYFLLKDFDVVLVVVVSIILLVVGWEHVAKH